jgi:leucyl-tRNA synthetase
MKQYDHKDIEKKWQGEWDKSEIYKASDESDKKKFFPLVEFPFPSGAGLHTGHTRSYTAMDIVARKRRMQGENVLYPIGWDAFGLPTENYAIKTGRQPKDVTQENTDNFRRQLKSVGLSFDWSREVNTTDPEYFKWTQWIFIKMFEKGLAYKAKIAINWCPKDKIGLANEEVVNGCCERCGTPVEQSEKEQWMLAITKYADRLYDDLDSVNYLDRIKTQQRNWIGRSEGAELSFAVKGSPEVIRVFTTRPDTLFGVTYVVLAPEHPLVAALPATNRDAVTTYVSATAKKDEIERTDAKKQKTGVRMEGVTVINPATGEEVPVFVADYVLVQYGTGAVMAVPAHDERDADFAKAYGLPVRIVIEGESLVESGAFSGMSPEAARKPITDSVGGSWVKKFKLRDWVFSRQRYWGEPMPMINCAKCGWVPVPESQLPVELPAVTKYEPTDNGESPLAAMTDWVNVACPTCSGPARRETDTMPNWAGSSWYFLRYADPKNTQVLADPKKLAYWTPVDWYNGGMEHTTLHLLYSRFWHKFLFDIGVVPTSEPYMKRTSHGMILAEGGEKMSKSRGNVVNPDDLVASFGADTLRVYQMFMGPFDQAIAWDTRNMIGPRRFIERVYALAQSVSEGKLSAEADTLLQKTIVKVSQDIESMGFNTAVSSLMILSNELEKSAAIPRSAYETFLKLLAPFAPHVTEELWHALGNAASIHASAWPVADESKLASEEATIAVQINGKVRATFKASKTATREELERLALDMDEVSKWVGENKPEKVIVVPGRMVSIVVRPA